MTIKISISNQDELRKYFKNNTLYLDKNSKLTFFKDLKVGSNNRFSGKVIIGKKNKIFDNCTFVNAKIGNYNKIESNSYIKDSKINNSNKIGPFAFIRSDCKIGDFNRVGVFVEIVRASIKHNVQISHQAIIIDISLGNNVIIGAGVCVANYYKNKTNKSIVGRATLIGCNTTIVSPVNIGSDVIIGAGSLINFNVSNKKKILQKRTIS